MRITTGDGVSSRLYGLMYHDVTDDVASSGFSGAGPSSYKLTRAAFAEHLDLIEEMFGVAPVRADDLPAKRRESPLWSLTFDDGGISALFVGEELARRNWRGHFFVTTGRIGSAGFVDDSGIRALAEMGHVIGSHSVTHPERMSALAPRDLEYEWVASVETLAGILGKDVRTGSVPGGYYSRRVAAAAAGAGIVSLFTSEPVMTARRVHGCLVIGRYSIRTETSARVAASAAAGNRAVWLRQLLGWNLRKPAKTLAGERYERVRRAVLASRSTPRRRR